MARVPILDNNDKLPVGKLPPVFTQRVDDLETLTDTGRLSETELLASFAQNDVDAEVSDSGADARSRITRLLKGYNTSSSLGLYGVVRAEVQPKTMFERTNSGTDLPLAATYEAFQIGPLADNSNTFGGTILWLKKSGSAAASDQITIDIYSTTGGLPGTLLTGSGGSQVIKASALSSSTFTEVEALTRRTGIGAGALLWVVITGNTSSFILDGTNTGTLRATSTDGSTWSAASGSPRVQLRGQNIAGVQGTSETYIGVRGDSRAYYGGYFDSVTGVGARGHSIHGLGVEGVSDASDGVKGYTAGGQGHGVRGESTNGKGVWGKANGGGVYGESPGGFPGVEGVQTGTGIGVKGTSVTHHGGHFITDATSTTRAAVYGQATNTGTTSAIGVWGESRKDFSGYFRHPNSSGNQQHTLAAAAYGGQVGSIIAVLDSANALCGGFDRNGYLYTTKSAAPTDATLSAGQLAFWFDSTSGAAKIKFKAKDAGGTVRTGEVALS